MTPGIIILEGADAAGKTTLARHLVEQHGARYIHLGPYKDVWRWHLGAYLRAERLASEGHLVVVDRHWLSEIAYGTTYRGESQYPMAARCFDRLWLRSAAVTMLCVPEDLERQVAEHERLKQERHEFASNARPVIEYYANLRWGDMTAAGEDYLAQWVRFGDFTKRFDVETYDRFREGDDLDRVAKRVLRRLQTVRLTQHPLGLDHKTPNFAGNWSASSALLVGEAPGPGAHPRAGRFPFIDRCSHLSSATWLNRALYRLHRPETHLCWVNAEGPELAELADAARLISAKKIVALGRVAERAVSVLDWPPEWRVEHVPHPQWARRFAHAAPYEDMLWRAL